MEEKVLIVDTYWISMVSENSFVTAQLNINKTCLQWLYIVW